MLVALLSAIWGTTYFVIAQGLRDLPPFTSAAARFGSAALLMAVVAAAVGRRESGRAPSWRLSVLHGVLSFGVSYGLVYWAETRLPSGLVSVLWATFPMMIAMGGHWVLPNERLVGRQWAGLFVAFGGVVLLCLTDVRALGPGAIPVALCLLASPAVSTVSHLVLKSRGSGVRSLLLNRNAMTVGALCHVVMMLLCEADAEAHWTPRAWASVAYLSVVGTVVTFGVYFWALRTVPAVQLSLIAFLTPGLALATGALLGGESVGVTTVGGTALVLVGVASVLRRSAQNQSDAAEPTQEKASSNARRDRR